MKKSNPNQSQNHSLKRRKKNDPRYKRVLVGHRLVAMQAHHVDQITAAETRPGSWWNECNSNPRCPKCFLRLREGRRDHFCRWNVKREGPRDSAREILRVPIYRWFLRDEKDR